MTETPGSVPWLEQQAERRLRQDYQRAKQIRDIAQLNFDTWPQMTDQEKDVTMRQTQRGMAELASMITRLCRSMVGELREE